MRTKPKSGNLKPIQINSYLHGIQNAHIFEEKSFIIMKQPLEFCQVLSEHGAELIIRGHSQSILKITAGARSKDNILGISGPSY